MKFLKCINRVPIVTKTSLVKCMFLRNNNLLLSYILVYVNIMIKSIDKNSLN
jgi:hypothetical protein